MRCWWDATWGVVRRDAILFFSYRTQAVTQLFGLLFNLTLFYYISRLLSPDKLGGAEDYFSYVVVGLVILQALVATLDLIPGSVRQELVAGTLERYLVSRFGARNGILAMMIFPTSVAIITGIVLLALATAVFGLDLAPTAPLAIPVVVLCVATFTPLTLMLVSVVTVIKQASAGTQFVLSGIAIIGGLYFPTDLLPGWLEWLSEVLPFTVAAETLRHLLVDAPLDQSLLASIAQLAGFAIVFIPISHWILGKALVHGQRRGTIIEY